MESVVFLIASLLLVALAAAAMLWLHRQAREQLSRERASLEADRSRAASEFASMRAYLTELSSSTLETASRQMSQSQMASITALDSFVKESTRSQASSLEQTTKLLASTVTLLGSKDPIAYQQAMAAQAPMPPVDQQGLYPAATGGLDWVVDQEAAAEQARQFLESHGLGGLDVDPGGYPTVPVTVPGSDTGAAFFTQP